jgi:phage terminase large subunit
MTAPALLHHTFVPRGAVRAAFHSRAPEILLSGPAGTGKSRGLLEKLLMLALMNPGMRGLIARKTLASLGNTALDTWRKFVVKEALEGNDVAFYGGSPEEPPQYRFANGSVIVVGGLDRPTRIMSSEYDVIYVQEAIELTETDWESLTTRLRNWRITFQQLLADTNPDTPTHWLKQRCDRGATLLLESRHEDNPRLFDTDKNATIEGAAYIGKLDALTGVRHHRLRKGLWVAAEGMCYESFDPAVNLVDRMNKHYIGKDWTRWWSIDFGYTNPFVCQFWAEDPDGRLHLYREIYHTKRLVEEHAAEILSLVRRPKPDLGRDPDPARSDDWEWTEPRPRAIICDHDAEGRATLERHLGMSTSAAVKTVTEGIQATDARFRPAGDGKPRLVIRRDALVRPDPELVDRKLPTCTAEEIVGYVWAPPTAGRAPKEEPVKINDHGCDAMRYMVAEKDLSARPTLRWL